MCCNILILLVITVTLHVNKMLLPQFAFMFISKTIRFAASSARHLFRDPKLKLLRGPNEDLQTTRGPRYDADATMTVFEPC